ncbi:tol-pal system protein YbgF [Limnohabitans sp. TS-CS-82]|jgi:tol-pal system protein YbgF|uniref:tol-pal system protein YbgF n=1 Tax=Limnohabitans sp. TS-CS-82 TaxID=2094193 RepID=UPI000CF1F3BC|nr:tol-pal system protein YbgF [Limnohabitans sp. TS-CS-82]PQA81524.1 tol-pal system protein YbgF [Limnohabitans sp. TS-CS-82]
MKTPVALTLRVAALAVGLWLTPVAHAALFADDEARRAIIDLRERVERQGEEIKQFQRSLLDQQEQFESLRKEAAQLRGEKEELTQELRKQQNLAKDLAQGVDERLRKFEPVKVKVDGVEFLAEPAEVRAYDDAVAVFRKGDFTAASASLGDFIRRYPKSGYATTALFWLGNAQYANREYKEAIRNFSVLLVGSPNHLRAPEAMLSVANCQLELKDIKAARKTFEDVIKTYPQSEAASAARERLSKLK